MSDLVVLCAVVLAFAIFGTIHVVICGSLLGRVPFWQAALALIVVPLAPALAFKIGAKRLAVLWGVAATIYLVCLGWACF